jgi:hypothetical protein
VSICDVDGGKRYAATAILSSTAAPMSLDSVAALEDAKPLTGPYYGGVLFHGPRFQVIAAVEALGAAGAVAQLRGARVVDDAAHNCTDVGLIDGALQLALRWTEHTLHGASLPTHVHHIDLHRVGPVPGMVTAQLRACREGNSAARAVCDVVLVDDKGQAIVSLIGVETHLLPQPEARPTSTAP